MTREEHLAGLWEAMPRDEKLQRLHACRTVVAKWAWAATEARFGFLPDDVQAELTKGLL